MVRTALRRLRRAGARPAAAALLPGLAALSLLWSKLCCRWNGPPLNARPDEAQGYFVNVGASMTPAAYAVQAPGVVVSLAVLALLLRPPPLAVATAPRDTSDSAGDI